MRNYDFIAGDIIKKTRDIPVPNVLVVNGGCEMYRLMYRLHLNLTMIDHHCMDFRKFEFARDRVVNSKGPFDVVYIRGFDAKQMAEDVAVHIDSVKEGGWIGGDSFSTFNGLKPYLENTEHFNNGITWWMKC